VKEDEVDSKPLRGDAQPSLASDEREVSAEFEQKGLELGDQRVFEVALRVLVLETEELEDEGVLDLFFWRHAVLGLGHGPLPEHRGLVPGEGSALVELALDLVLELPNGPPATDRFFFVEFPRHGQASAPNQQDVVGPRQNKSGRG
jgi:hypothetical protein